MYSRASLGETRSANSTSKKTMPSPAIVNGFTSQLTTSVTHSPFGRRPTSFSDVKSTPTIIG